MENSTAKVTPPGLIWRPVTRDDLAAVVALARECWLVDGGIAFLNEPDNLERRYFRGGPGAGIGAFAADGRLIACTMVYLDRQPGSERALIAGQVEPEWRGRGIGSYLMRWSQAQAHALFTDTVEDGRLLQIATETLTEPAHQFYQAYYASFRDRPGFPGWSATEWITWTDDDNHRPAWSLLAQADGEPMGFVTGGLEHIDPFIMQIGVIPEQRRRGIASALLVEAMARMRADGETATELTVNVNNPGAIAAYVQLGFETVGRRARFERTPASRKPDKA